MTPVDPPTESVSEPGVNEIRRAWRLAPTGEEIVSLSSDRGVVPSTSEEAMYQ